MNRITNEKSDSRMDMEILDAVELLVENELSDDACQELLNRIADQPQYWKIIAFAFIEQQRISHSFQRMAKREDAPTVPLETIRRETNTSNLNLLGHRLAIAACLAMMTFSTVAWLRSRNPSPSENDRVSSASAINREQQIADADPRIGSLLHLSPKVAGYVEWRDQLGDQLLPVFHGTEVDEDWLKSHPLQMDKRLVESLSRAGWQANPSRRFVSIKLVDGDAYTIPVSDVYYRYVGKSVY